MRQSVLFLIACVLVLTTVYICYGDDFGELEMQRLESCLRALPVDSYPNMVSYHDGYRLLAIGDSSGVRVYQSQNTSQICQLNLDDSKWLSDHQLLSFNPQGNLLIASQGEYSNPGAWHIPSGNPIIFEALPSFAQISTFTPDGEDFIAGVNFIAGGKYEKVLLSYATQSGLLRVSKRKLKPWLIKLDPKIENWSDAFVTATNRMKTVVYATGNTIQVFNGRKLIDEIPVPNSDKVENLTLSWTGDTLAAVHEGLCSTWDLRPGASTESPISTINFEDYEHRKAFSLSPTGKYLISYHNKSDEMRVLTRTTNGWHPEENNGSKLNAVGFAPSGAMILLRARDDDVSTFQLEYRPASDSWTKLVTDWVKPTGKAEEVEYDEQEQKASGPRIMVQRSIGENLIAAPVLSANGGVLVSASEKGVFAWDTKTGRQISQFVSDRMFGEHELWLSNMGRWLAVRNDLSDDFAAYDILNQRTIERRSEQFRPVSDFHPTLSIKIVNGTKKLYFRPISRSFEDRTVSHGLRVH